MVNKKQKSLYKGREVYYKWIPSKDYKKFKPITQVCGVCFTKEGKILIIRENKEWKLPGGKPEKGEIPEETLKREAFEEATVILDKCSMIGTCEVIFPDNPNTNQGGHFYQLRYFSLIKKIKKHTKDTFSGKKFERKFIKPSEFTKYIKWGKIGEEMLSATIKEYDKNNTN